MRKYLDITRQLPRPTQRQLTDFTDHVCQAHSWYKHLTLEAPGFPFAFYLDPNAGCDLLIQADGSTSYRERTESAHRFHYSALLTRVYRERFGHLEFFSPVGRWIMTATQNGNVLCTRGPWPKIFVGSKLGFSPSDAVWRMIYRMIRKGNRHEIPNEVRNGKSVLKSFAPPTSFLSQRGWLDVPEKILEVGFVWLTGVIHPESSQMFFWEHKFSRDDAAQLQWPDESGGSKTLEDLRAIVKNPPQDAEAEIDRLLKPERSRQKRLMVEAMGRMLNVIHQ